MFGKSHICGSCGEKVDAVKESKGSILILLVLILFFIIPGVIYLIWMLSGRRDQCPKCKSFDVVKIKTPRGQKLMHEYGHAK